MRDKSIFCGIKELDGYRFEDDGSHWEVRRHYCGGWVWLGCISKERRESNRALLARGKALQEDRGDDES